jgi:lysophospholipase L1-like esterase
VEWTTTRYDDDVLAVRQQIKRRRFTGKPIVFFGSSSFRYWHRMAEDFGSLEVANLGFGGGTAESGLRYCDSLLDLVEPGRIVLYFGENDIANDGLDASSAFAAMEQLTRRLREKFGSVPIDRLSIKHSPGRWLYAGEFNAFNAMLKESHADGGPGGYVDVCSCLLGKNGRPMGRCYEADGVHLNAFGYARWADVIAASVGLSATKPSV